MTKVVIARKSGDEYQDDWFWLQAARLFHQGTHVKSIGYEVENLIGFDDVVLFYNDLYHDEFGDKINADYFQVKYHMDYNGAIKVQSLIDPSFINTKKTTLLQRIQAMQRILAPDGRGARFILVSPWTIHPDDMLSKIITTDNGQIRFEKLFDGKKRSDMAEVRHLWATHLKLDTEDELKTVLRPFRIQSELATKKNLSGYLSTALVSVGLAPIKSEYDNQYHAVIRQLHQVGRTIFTCTDLTQACKDAGLYVGLPEIKLAVTTLGVKSFQRWVDPVEDETEHLLDFTPFFENRTIRDSKHWNGDILAEIKTYFDQCIKPGKKYHIHLDTHSSICFAVGYYLDMKTGANVIPVQRIPTGRIPWDILDNGQMKNYINWTFEEISVGEGDEVAIVVSVTHDIVDDVRLFVSKNLPTVGQIINFKIGVPNSNSIKDGTHAFYLAQQFVTLARTKRPTQPGRHSHLFIAAPNGLTYLIGRHGKALGSLVLYEYDFDSNLPGMYYQSIILPN